MDNALCMVSRQRKHELWRRQEVRASKQYIELVQRKEQLLKDIEVLKNAERDEIKTTREVRMKMATERDKLKKQLKQVRAKIAYMNAHLGEFAPKKPYSRVNKK